MPPPLIREPGDGIPKYGANYGYFTVELHHGGNFYVKPNNLTHEHGLVIFFDFFHASLFTKSNLMKFFNAVGHKVKLEFYYKKRRMSLGQGLRRLESENDIKEMLKDRDGHPVVVVFVVASSQLHAFPLHASISEVDIQCIATQTTCVHEKGGRPKKNRRKEPNEVESSSQAKKSRKSSQQEIPFDTTSTGMSSAGKRAAQTQTCRKCGEPRHNRRSYKGAPPAAAGN